jgi:hypothetical protein
MKTRLAGLLTGLIVAIAAIDHPTCPEPSETETSKAADSLKVELGDDPDDDAADDWVAQEAVVTSGVNVVVAHQAEEAFFARDHAAEVRFPPWRLGTAVRS